MIFRTNKYYLLILLAAFIVGGCGNSSGNYEEIESSASSESTTTSSGVFVAVGSSGIILKSSDGTTWSSVSTVASDNAGDNSSNLGFGSSNQLNDISYGSSTYVIVGSNFSGSAGSIYTSSDGTTWTLRSSGTTKTLYGVAYTE